MSDRVVEKRRAVVTAVMDLIQVVQEDATMAGTPKRELYDLREGMAAIGELVTDLGEDDGNWTRDDIAYVVSAVEGLLVQRDRAARQLGQQDADLRRLRGLINVTRLLDSSDRDRVRFLERERDRLEGKAEALKAEVTAQRLRIAGLEGALSGARQRRPTWRRG